MEGNFEEKKLKQKELQRKQELEKKRERLRQLREGRKAAGGAAANSTTASAKPQDPLLSSTSSLNSGRGSSSPNFDGSVLDKLGLSSTPKTQDSGLSGLDSIGKQQPLFSKLVAEFSAEEKEKQEQQQAQQQVEKKALNMSMDEQVLVFDVAPKIKEAYNKITQTTESCIQTPDDATSETQSNAVNTEDEENDDQKKDVAVLDSYSSLDVSSRSQSDQTTAGMKEFSQAQVNEIMQSSDFNDFFSRASLLVERALNEPYDVLIDYAEADAVDENTEDHVADKISERLTFFDERWSKNRAVTSVSWSTNHPELCMVSHYSKIDAMSKDPEGVVLIWSLHLPQRPEYTFYCSSPVSTSFFAKYRPNIIVGGTYSGQIVLWDRRAKKLPVQRSDISSRAHTQPIFGMQMVGTANANNLVSLSTDGRMCIWSLENMSKPQEVLDLHNPHGKPPDIFPYSLSFPDNESDNFFVGGENGKLYSGYRLGSKAGVSSVYDGHFGPITSADCHPSSGSVDLSSLMLTSSMDWTCKLWSKEKSTPICSFEEYDDYVYDIRWSPVHPALFATVDGTGRLLIWNLNQDSELPFFEKQVVNHSLSKLRWSPDGRRIAVGDSLGHTYIYEIDKEIAVPSSDAWPTLSNRIKDFDWQTPDVKLS